ncbi:CDP-paratose 2-epimerase [Thermosporothrix hazakensis]|jgi:CDP-paratose 2-epimerase|uniref:CDP-paratose 2-epimerase n=2 Tax=Thermosporothrix TaxID=768650 RepID=A0A326UAF9_THEHA|nr:NAD-dependent epimerase/dehydratase family protein [Thermosporothrix hazakensis]PZW31920.1 CDP-paratose 2-epimerase [Thermosporothrix hazakensis]BBH91610.1 CDP-paratose 2-epimerase [Thermosporothrix sp. COM3]GCE49755.1 CDP-paratose 2-epimerase [Thermosporothrix hazakensis]
MKVLVTGGCGFLGSHVCEFYRKRGDEVIAYDNMTKHELARTGYATEQARRYNADFLRSIGATIIEEDIRDYERLLRATQGCDFLVHTAAQPAMTISLEDVDLDFSTNVTGTLHVLKAARHYRIPLVSCSSVHVYGNQINNTLQEQATRFTAEPQDIDEAYPTMRGLLTPLHASKHSAESYVQAFIDSYEVEAANFRLTGFYGPRQFGGEDHGWVANFCIRAALGWPITIFGTDKQVRDILYVQDVVNAIHAFYEQRKPGTYNIGGGYAHAISLKECLDIISHTLKKSLDIQMQPARKGDLWYFVCNSAKAEHALGWTPHVSPATGIEKLLTWIQENRTCFQENNKANASSTEHAKGGVQV